ncbi:MAG: ABC transporter permease [Jatrophihabitans sp.]|uniref:ABC transporter permease n=1 Tax=Jatrophihabitans sp. TaxID=1932789 RepID=UPI00390D9825
MLETHESLERPTAAQGDTSATDFRTEREFTVNERSRARMAFRLFLRHRVAAASVVVFVLLCAFAFIGPLVWHYSYTFETEDLSVGPSAKHPFGTDSLGVDGMATVMRGTAQSLKVAFIIGILGTGAGALWGVIAGYLGGFTDSALMRLADLILTIPALALAAALARAGGGSLWQIGVILAAVSAPYVARVVRGVVLSLREREFIEAARALGASNLRIMFRHLMPNTLPVLIVNATLLIAAGILAETALSYVGFGIQSPDTSLGVLITQAQGAVDTRPWLFYFPGLFIILIALTVNFIGDGLRDALDPRQTRERR